MTRHLRSALSVTAFVSLAACGGARLAATPEATAQAVHTVSQGSSDAQRSATQRLLAQALARHREQGSSFTTEVSTACAKAGSVMLKISAIDTDGSGTTTMDFDMKYAGCSQDGGTRMDGTLTTKMVSRIGIAGTSLDIHLKGKVSLSGEISDFIDADVTEGISADLLEADSGNVSISLLGSVTTSSGTYTFDGAPVVITPGAFISAG